LSYPWFIHNLNVWDAFGTKGKKVSDSIWNFSIQKYC
jgi:hypothetical protein